MVISNWIYLDFLGIHRDLTNDQVMDVNATCPTTDAMWKEV